MRTVAAAALVGLAFARLALRQPLLPVDAVDAGAPVAVVNEGVDELADQLASLGTCSCACCSPLPTGEQCVVSPTAPDSCADPCIPNEPEVIVGGKDGVELIRYCIVECHPQLSGECESLTLSASLPDTPATLAPTPAASIPLYIADEDPTPAPTPNLAYEEAKRQLAAAVAASEAVTADVDAHTEAAKAAADSAEEAVGKIQATVAEIPAEAE